MSVSVHVLISLLQYYEYDRNISRIMDKLLLLHSPRTCVQINIPAHIQFVRSHLNCYCTVSNYCFMLMVLSTKFFLYFREEVAKAVSQLCERLSAKKVENFTVEWLLAIPLYHFLMNVSKPYDKPKFVLQVNTQSYNDRFGLPNMKRKAYKEDK